jgi:hypothetical protein
VDDTLQKPKHTELTAKEAAIFPVRGAVKISPRVMARLRSRFDTETDWDDAPAEGVGDRRFAAQTSGRPIAAGY